MEEIKREEQEWHHIISMEDLGGLNRKLNIFYDNVGVKMALDKATDIVVKQAQVKGYRKGKAPKKLVEQYYYEAIENTAKDLLAQEGFLNACFEQKISPLSEPKLENPEFKVDGTFSCDIILEIRPQINLSNYIGLPLQKKPNPDMKHLFEHKLEDIREEHKKMEIREKVKDNYVVLVDYWVLVEGKEITSGKDQRFLIKTDQEPPFGNNLIDRNMGEIVSSTIVLPERHEQYGGKQADIKIELKLVEEKILPTNEELVEKMKAPSFEALISLIQKDVEQEVNRFQKAYLEEQAIDKLIELHPFETPTKWVEDEEKFLISQLNLSNIDEETKKYVNTMAVKNVKRTFLIDEIYNAEKDLAIRKEEYDELIKREAERLDMSTLALEQELKTKKLIDGVIANIKQNKVMNFLLSQAIITEEKIEEEQKIIVP